MSTIIAEAKVGMLGHTGSGKTCFMYGMYNAFSDFAMRLPFTLYTQNARDDAIFRTLWEKIEDEEWSPPGTDFPMTYLLELRASQKPLINISWIDYRGAALWEDATPEEDETLRTQLVEADCLFFCVESGTLESRKAKDRNKIGRLGTLSRDLPPVPLVILVSKADLFQSVSNEPDTSAVRPQAPGTGPAPLPPIDPALEELVRSRFHPWFEQNRQIMISPASIKPDNRYFDYLPAPFAYTAYKIVQAKCAEKTELLKLNDSLLQKRTKGVKAYWYYLGTKTTRELREKLETEREILEALKKRMTTLEDYFSRASIFQGHERVTLAGGRWQAPR